MYIFTPHSHHIEWQYSCEEWKDKVEVQKSTDLHKFSQI